MGANSTSFQKNDPRINRKGRPKSFDALRKLAQDKAGALVLDADGKPLVRDGNYVTVSEQLLHDLATSDDWRAKQAFIEIAYGKVPQQTELTGKDGGDIHVKHGIGDDLAKAIEKIYGGQSGDTEVN